MSLLKEIDTICKKHGIRYFLSPQLTRCAVTNQPFPESPLTGVVIMTVPDMERFRQIVEETALEGRELEYMGNSKYFPGFYLRYVNKNTLCYRLNEGMNFRCPGIGITILPLRGKIQDRKIRRWNHTQETGWQQTCYVYGEDERENKDFFRRLYIRILSLGGRGRLGRSLYRKFCKRQDVPDTKEYTLCMKIKTVNFKTDIFEKSVPVVLEGETFQAPGKTEKYLEEVYGKNYQGMKVDNPGMRTALMVSGRIGYEEFFARAGSPKKLAAERRRLHRWGEIGRKNRAYLDWCWEYVKFCAAKKHREIYYSKKKDYIINLYENKDYMKLESVFRPYTRLMERCLKDKDVYVPDSELMDIYLDVLKKTGREKLLAQVEKQWRQCAKREMEI